ncbi:hypothetical protein GCM10017567_00710 [Amycolatopsis bullii]|uniref:Uncharacterized protein n=1 Tax=Amycolatopsis bullii TaxID=941987 RepID=A0ABQ3K1P9_9PSEU|nr:hypothetical protein GCM10017567_00710 [Amycolatopsis bullii]
MANRGALEGEIERIFAKLTGTELEARLTAGRIAHARRRDLPEVLAHPQLTARDRFAEVATPAGPVRATLPPITVLGRAPRMDAVPALGEHTDAVLAEFGFDAETLRRQGEV